MSTAEAVPSCRALSEQLNEPLAGSAAHAPAWLLVEHPGPWGPTAPKDVSWPGDLGPALSARTDVHGIRLGLIRRPERTAAARSTRTEALLIHTGPQQPWVRRYRLADPAEVLALDLAGLGQGTAPPEAEPAGPILAVCAHGSRDACCAVAGRPVAAALAEQFGAAVWETTHVGGHRFAGNLVCFPHGLMFGRLDATSAVAVAEDYERGRIGLPHYRGRTCWPGAVQAAEQHLRAALQLTDLDAVEVLGHTGTQPVEVDLLARTAGGESRHRLRVETDEQAPARPFSCGSTKLEAPPRYRVR